MVTPFSLCSITSGSSEITLHDALMLPLLLVPLLLVPLSLLQAMSPKAAERVIVRLSFLKTCEAPCVVVKENISKKEAERDILSLFFYKLTLFKEKCLFWLRFPVRLSRTCSCAWLRP